MQSFLIGLQFLTRIQLQKQTVWTEESFGRSVRYFPLVGLVLGICYGLAAFAMAIVPQVYGFHFPEHIRTFILMLLPVILTGGIHCDGFMDTVDGIFSGRDRERMLEIMKDSRAGSFGVVAMILLLLGNYAALLDMPAEWLTSAMVVMPVIGRLMMAGVVSCCKYARPEGIGKAFAQYNNARSFLWVLMYSLVLVSFLSVAGLIAIFACGIFTAIFCYFIDKKLGGVTGYVYGAVCILNELLVLYVYVIIGCVFVR